MVVVVEYNKIRKEYPEFMSSWEKTKNDAKAKAAEVWGLKFGGLYPASGEFGETTIRPRFLDIGTTTARETWNRNLGTAGWNTVIDNNVLEDVYLGILGFGFPNASNRIGAIKLEAGAAKLPVLNLEGEIELMENPAVMFEAGLIIPGETLVKLRVNAITSGNNVIKPLGFALAKSKVLIDETPD